ncbi:lambda-exonuclease family protein [Endozoicomonas arenosclerae]|uniref:lambda-exonuclease family protein n=1 Tax=Endozoicomonas arenosclerae TaxID=1633495 RepID=UPI000784EFE0|nr:YqaJ viral recombinase family protein [Endozoicomonas arenosclerae]
MKQVNLEQRSNEWLDWRRFGVTASDAAVLLPKRAGQSPSKSRWQLWAEKSGILEEPDLSSNPYVQRGIEDEDDARNLMEQALGDAPLLPVCGEWDHNRILRASFDGITKDGIPVELKAPCEKVYQEVKALKDQSEGYRRAFAQVQFQMLVADAPRAWLCFYHKGLPILPACINRDKHLIQQLQKEAEAFWQLVENGDEPEKDPNLDVFVPEGLFVQAQWHKLATDYRRSQCRLDELKNQLDSEKSQQKLLQQDFQKLMGAFRVAESDGLRICCSKCTGSIDYQKALESLCKEHQLALPDLDAFRRMSREQVRVTLLDRVDDSESEREVAGNERWLNPTVNNHTFYF